MCIVNRQDKPNVKTCAGRRTTTRNTKPGHHAVTSFTKPGPAILT
jgi:hypothetical protein